MSEPVNPADDAIPTEPVTAADDADRRPSP